MRGAKKRKSFKKHVHANSPTKRVQQQGGGQVCASLGTADDAEERLLRAWLQNHPCLVDEYGQLRKWVRYSVKLSNIFLYYLFGYLFYSLGPEKWTLVTLRAASQNKLRSVN